MKTVYLQVFWKDHAKDRGKKSLFSILEVQAESYDEAVVMVLRGDLIQAYDVWSRKSNNQDYNRVIYKRVPLLLRDTAVDRLVKPTWTFSEN